MKAFETFAIYITPFLIIGAAVSFLMKRYAVDLSDVEKQAGPKPSADFSWELGALKTEAASVNGLFLGRPSTIAHHLGGLLVPIEIRPHVGAGPSTRSD